MKCFTALAFAIVCAPAFAEPPSAWLVPDAPIRVAFRAKDAPTIPEAGWLLQLPELGATMQGLVDVIATDAKGVQIPLARISRMEGHEALLLAPVVPKDADIYVYYGGKRVRREMKWNPAISLLLETRRLPAGAKMESWADLDSAWKASRESDGAGFVGSVAHGENPFGEGVNFASRYTGFLKTDDKSLQLYTISSDASFVAVNDKPVFGWPGKHTARANQKEVHTADVANPKGMLKVEYLHAKDAAGIPTMLLGWVKGGKFETIPATAWVHPGRTEITKTEHVAGWPIPQVDAVVSSYIGYEGQWLFETKCALKTKPAAGWKTRWEWSDGAVFDGETCQRVLVGPAPARVIVRITDGQKQGTGAKQIEFNGTFRAASIQQGNDLANYLALIDREEPARLAPVTIAGHLALVSEFGTDQLLGRYGAAWVTKNPGQSDPMWLAGQTARIRGLAQTNPKAAIAELRKFDIQTRKKFPQFSILEMDILVFGMKSPEAIQAAQRISFDQPNSENQRLAKIRVGDLYRLLGRVKDARLQYESVQKTIADDTGGKKLPAMDRAYSITISGLIDQDQRKAAEAKLVEWESEHPMAKYDSDFLLLRGRVLMMFGRWNEALQEIESFRAMNPDNPFQIPADFYRARALAELGQKDEAKKIWSEIATNYPKHELAAESARLAR